MSAPRASIRSNRGFGRRQPFVRADSVAPVSTLSDDARLFLLNFLGGLIFMTVYLS
jgi:hypothetical protein